MQSTMSKIKEIELPMAKAGVESVKEKTGALRPPTL